MSTNCKAQLKGNLGQEPKIIQPDNGKEFVVLSVATTDAYRDKNNQWQSKETLWHDVIIFRPNTIKFAKQLKKGDSVHIEGTLSYKQVETKEGYKVQQASIIASYVAKTSLPENDKEASEQPYETV